ncbi:hypothetical protein, partial [Eggerthella sinensis]|uniref:hypothetical protein n=1 Tax=Eggerthella sinensis TaxID=242230 RepID=UPI0022DEA3C9
MAQAAAEAVPETAPEELADGAEANAQDAQNGQDAQTTSGPRTRRRRAARRGTRPTTSSCPPQCSSATGACWETPCSSAA